MRNADAAAALLRAARACAATLGVSFHVGSQCLDPLAWRDALALSGEVIRAAGVTVDVIDVGGGFPVAYPDQEPPPMGAFFAEIEAGFDRLGLPRNPSVGGTGPRAGGCGDVGRAAGAGPPRRCAVCQRRRLRQPGGCRTLGFRYPARLIRPGREAAAETLASRCSGRPATALT